MINIILIVLVLGPVIGLIVAMFWSIFVEDPWLMIIISGICTWFALCALLMSRMS